MLPIGFMTILSITFIASNGSNVSVCVDKGYFAEIRGPFKHLLFNETFNGDVYYYPRPQKTHYLYPFKTSTNYFYVIGMTLYGNFIHSHCLIGNIGVLGVNYMFNINHCQYWAFYNGTKDAWQHAADMIVTECQFDDACIQNSIYLPYLNTDYKYMYWNYTVNGAYYYNQVINKWIYPHLSQNDNITNAKYIIDSVVDNTFANAYCVIGNGVSWYYVFRFDDCQLYKSYYQLSWQTEPNMTVSTNCINQQTSIPTTSSSKYPTAIPTISPTASPSTLNPTTDQHIIYSTSLTTNTPTLHVHATQYPSISVQSLTSTANLAITSTSGLHNIGGKTNETNQPIFSSQQIWYFVAATGLFVVLTILIVIIGCLCQKNKKRVQKISDVQLARPQRLESDASNIHNTDINKYTLIAQQLPGFAVVNDVVHRDDDHYVLNVPLPNEDPEGELTQHI